MSASFFAQVTAPHVQRYVGNVTLAQTGSGRSCALSTQCPQLLSCTASLTELFSVLLRRGDKAILRSRRGQHITTGHAHPHSRHLYCTCPSLFPGRCQVTAPVSSAVHSVACISIIHDCTTKLIKSRGSLLNVVTGPTFSKKKKHCAAYSDEYDTAQKNTNLSHNF